MGATNPNDPVDTPPHLAPFLVNNHPVPDEGQLRARRDADLAGIQNAMFRLMGEYQAVASAYATVLSPGSMDRGLQVLHKVARLVGDTSYLDLSPVDICQSLHFMARYRALHAETLGRRYSNSCTRMYGAE